MLTTGFLLVSHGVELGTYKDDINAGKFRPKTDNVLDSWKRLDEIWSNPPTSGHLHVLVSVSNGE